MLKYLGHKTSYWENNKPKQIGDQKVNTDDWNKIIRILKRINKCVSFNKIARHYRKKKFRELYKNILIFNNSRTRIEALKEHSYLMTYIYDQEKKRQENIDNKARQIITNVSLVFTFIAFSSAIILNKDNYVNGVSEYSLFAVLIALIIALIALILAVMCLDVKKYSRPRQDIVFDPKYILEEDFLRQKVSDFFVSLNDNTDTNSKKSNYVKFANRLFIFSIGLVGLFTILNLYAIKLRNDKTITTRKYMEYISTSALANEIDKKPAELFDKLKTFGWIERKNDKWVLTDLGKQKGGQTRANPKYGEFIVWPENISLDGGQEQQYTGKSKLLNATSIGKHYNISSQRLNLIFSELGWIEKALIGQDVNGWAVTKLGKSIGGRQFEHETSGGSYVLWPETILLNKSLKEVFSDNQTGKGISNPSPTSSQQQSTSQQLTDDYREKWEAKHRTLDGHYVRSRAEVIIDNLLYQYGLVHAYERKIIIGDEEVLSDFYLPAGKVYIEFWGMDGDAKYSERKKKKIEFYKKNDIPLIELNDNDILSLDDHLPRKLKDYGIKVY